jgi:hypothetical protein
MSPGEVLSLFIRQVSIPLWPAIVKSVRLESAVRILCENCNLKICNALQRNFRDEIALRKRRLAASPPSVGENELLL